MIEAFTMKALRSHIAKLENLVQNLKETNESHKKSNRKLRKELRKESLKVKKWEILLKDIGEERNASKRN